MRKGCRFNSWALSSALMLLLLPGWARAQRPELLRGRVIADSSGIPIWGATVVVTIPPDRALMTATTDSAGRFELRVARGTSDYLVHVNLLGWQPWRQRVRLAPGETGANIEVRLAAKPIVLAPLVAPGTRRPSSESMDNLLPAPGSEEQTVEGSVAGLTPGHEGDLAAQAATIPGIAAVTGGISVLGLPGSQNTTTLNGLSFDAGVLPRGMSHFTRVATSVFDPSRGGFSGAEVAADLATGGWYKDRTAYLTLDAPALQYTDPVAARTGQRFGRISGAFDARGELNFNRLYYSASAQVDRSRVDAISLATAGADVLQPAGLSPDSAARFLGLLGAAGIPAGSFADTRSTTTARFGAQLDHTPSGEHSWVLTGIGSYTTSDPGPSPLATAATGVRPSSYAVAIQGRHRDFVGRDWLNGFKSGVSFGGSRSTPVLILPSASVLVGSSMPDGSGSIASVRFGGLGSSATASTHWTWEMVDQLELYGRKRPHKLKLYAESRLDGFDSSAGMSYGSYAYASLADLAANRPSTYSRMLATPRAGGVEWSGALAISDSWRSKRLSLLYGVRAEANEYTSLPGFNPGVLSAFGARTDAVPNRTHVSPRLGFSYSLSGSPLDRWGIYGTPIAQRILPLKGVLRGGIGEFRSLLPASLLAGPMASTGLADATRRLACVGPAVPTPNWTALVAGAAPPDECMDGSGTFVDASPGVRLVDPSFDAPRSWRASLGWSGSVAGFGLTVDGFYSVNLNQPGTVDLNFTGTSRFTLADEGRPVFVESSAIVPTTGVVSPLDARRDPAFGQVVSRRSDLRGTSRQLTVTISPNETGFMRWGGRSGGFATLAYTLMDARVQARGFDGTAFGDPALRETAASPLDIRHSLLLQVGAYHNRLGASLVGRLNSGAPFTPTVLGDVNGDGSGGDRAFVFDPARVADPTLSAGMRSLLATASGRVRDCLERQLGQAAGLNSCRGPWTAAMNAQLRYSFRRTGVTANLANPLGGLDQLLHGPTHLRGWGTPALPNPMLLTVRGFDAAARRFAYQVNPRFGDTGPSTTTVRAPFRLTVDVRVNLGRSYSVQDVERAVVIAHRLPPAALRRRLSVIPNVYAGILEMSDSLLLSPDQTQALEEARANYGVRMDSLWAGLASYISSLPDHFDRAAAIARQDSVREQGWVITQREIATVEAILTPLQKALLPRWAATILKGEKYMIMSR